MTLKARHIVVHGRVQGVGFRFFVQNIGTRLGLGGNVCNCDDGSVEIVAEGDPGSLAEFVKEVSKGPSMARVTRVDVRDMPATGNYCSFQIEGW